MTPGGPAGRLYDDLRAFLADVLREIAAAGVLDGSPDVAATQLHALLDGLTLHLLLSRIDAPAATAAVDAWLASHLRPPA